MNDFITLACPSCNGSLALTSDADRFACPYCRREHLVRRSDGHVSLVPIIAKLERVEERVDQHASELAMYRLREERQTIAKRIEQQKYLIEDWNRVRMQAQADLAARRTRFVAGAAVALIVLGGAVALLLYGDSLPADLGWYLLPVSASAALFAVIARVTAGRLAEQVANTREILAELYRSLKASKGELSRVEAELEHHTRAARPA